MMRSGFSRPAYPFHGLFLPGRRGIQGIYDPFDAVICGSTKYGQAQQEADHFVPGQGPYEGVSGQIFEHHPNWLLSVHWLKYEREKLKNVVTASTSTLIKFI